MGIVSLICKQCAGQLNLPDDKDFAFCNHCGTKVVFKDDVTNITNIANTTNTHNTIQHITKVIHGREQSEAEDYIRNANALLSLGETTKAFELFNKSIEANPTDYRGWIGLVACTSRNFTDPNNMNCSGHKDRLEKAKKLANDEQKKEIEKMYAPLLEAKRRSDEEWERQYRKDKLKQDFGIENDTVTEYIGNDDHVVIPDGIKAIGESAFENCENIKSVIIPDSVEKIGSDAFKGCENLISIKIPKRVTEIENQVFAFCYNLEEITLHDSIILIGSWAFYNCGSLTSFTIPDSVDMVETNAFEGWTKTQTIYVNKTNSKKWDKHWNRDCKAKIVYI